MTLKLKSFSKDHKDSTDTIPSVKQCKMDTSRLSCSKNVKTSELDSLTPSTPLVTEARKLIPACAMVGLTEEATPPEFFATRYAESFGSSPDDHSPPTSIRTSTLPSTVDLPSSPSPLQYKAKHLFLARPTLVPVFTTNKNHGLFCKAKKAFKKTFKTVLDSVKSKAHRKDTVERKNTVNCPYTTVSVYGPSDPRWVSDRCLHDIDQNLSRGCAECQLAEEDAQVSCIPDSPPQLDVIRVNAFMFERGGVSEEDLTPGITLKESTPSTVQFSNSSSPNTFGVNEEITPATSRFTIQSKDGLPFEYNETGSSTADTDDVGEVSTGDVTSESTAAPGPGMQSQWDLREFFDMCGSHPDSHEDLDASNSTTEDEELSSEISDFETFQQGLLAQQVTFVRARAKEVIIRRKKEPQNPNDDLEQLGGNESLSAEDGVPTLEELPNDVANTLSASGMVAVSRREKSAL